MLYLTTLLEPEISRHQAKAQAVVRPLVENLTQLVGAFLLEPITPETVWRLENELQKQLQETGRQLLEDLFNHIEPDDADALGAVYCYNHPLTGFNIFGRTAVKDPAMLRIKYRLQISLRLLGILGLLLVASTAPADDSLLSRFAFGSCAKQDRPQPIWESVVAFRPQFFTFLGDNIYGDTEDMAVLRAKYQQLGNQPGYQKLKATCPIYATWDDHDYGVNDGGAEYPKKRESQQVFLNFFEATQDDVRRTREGVYSAQVFGPPGRRVQLILLDARYFRSPLKTGFQPGEPGDGYRGKYAPNTDPEATILGEAQWKWLEKQLRVPAELRFIGSGVQVIADEHGSEMWGNFPHERKRLFALIKQTKAEGVVFLSGDRHLAEIARLPTDHALGVGYPLYDITSSSLNTPSGNFTKAGTRFANEINSYRVGLTYFETNFGTVEIDWEQPDPVLRLQVRDAAGGVVLQHRVKLSELQRGPTHDDPQPKTDRTR